jgi:hypothetical protein
VPPAEGLGRFAVEQQDAQLGVELFLGKPIEPARQGLVTLRSVVDDQQGFAFPG